VCPGAGLRGPVPRPTGQCFARPNVATVGFATRSEAFWWTLCFRVPLPEGACGQQVTAVCAGAQSPCDSRRCGLFLDRGRRARVRDLRLFRAESIGYGFSPGHG